MSSRSCESCRHYLGGGCCAISMEQECADGGREAWEKQPPARALTLKEVQATKGTGWLENWLRADKESPEEICLTECAWLYGAILETDPYHVCVSEFERSNVAAQYGRKYGIRVWTEKPSESQRAKARWRRGRAG